VSKKGEKLGPGVAKFQVAGSLSMGGGAKKGKKQNRLEKKEDAKSLQRNREKVSKCKGVGAPGGRWMKRKLPRGKWTKGGEGY